MAGATKTADVQAKLYNYFVVGDKRFPGEITVSGDADTFGAKFADLIGDIADPGEDAAVTYEPREVQAAFKGGGNRPPNPPTATATQPPEESPGDCQIHNTPLTFRPGGISNRTGKPYPAFWSCSQKNADGSYCNWKPAK